MIPHTLDKKTHTYKVEGHFVWSVSDIISINGLSDYRSVPEAVLKKASERGDTLHQAVWDYEEKGESPDLDEHTSRYFRGYVRLRDEYDLQIVGPHERSIVYQHEGTDILIGGTPDLICLLRGELYVADLKSCFRQSGKAKAQKLLAWRLQTQGYWEALQTDQALWGQFKGQQMLRGVIHVHPDCGIETRGAERLGYEFHDFPMDDSLLWDGAIRMAQAKLSNGFEMERR